MTPARKAVLSYLREWLDWVEAGAVEGEPFTREYGLCSNAPDAAYAGLKEMLGADFGRDEYPFGDDDYDLRFDEFTQHECPARLAWVRAKLAEAGL